MENYIGDIEKDLNDLMRLFNGSLLEIIDFKIDNKLKFNSAIKIATNLRIYNLEKSIRALRDKLENN
jgi:hypothetical protein